MPPPAQSARVQESVRPTETRIAQQPLDALVLVPAEALGSAPSVGVAPPAIDHAEVRRLVAELARLERRTTEELEQLRAENVALHARIAALECATKTTPPATQSPSPAHSAPWLGVAPACRSEGGLIDWVALAAQKKRQQEHANTSKRWTFFTPRARVRRRTAGDVEA